MLELIKTSRLDVQSIDNFKLYNFVIDHFLLALMAFEIKLFEVYQLSPLKLQTLNHCKTDKN